MCKHPSLSAQMGIKMDNLRGVIKNLFCYMPPGKILSTDDRYRCIDEDLFVSLGANYIRQYSNDELRNMYHYMKHEFEWQNRKFSRAETGRGKTEQDEEYDEKVYVETGMEENLNVFDTLLAFNFSVLIEENSEPLCQYIHLLRWREMITALEEDLFVTSFLAKNDIQRGVTRKNFFWKPVIGHNNYALNKLMQKGIAENHFHLKGSAPMFHLSWINMMNYPEEEKFADILRTYDKNKLQKDMEIEKNQMSDSYVTMWRQAALIRVFLYTVIQDDYLEAPEAFCTAEEICRVCSESAYGEIFAYFKERNIAPDQRIRVRDHETDIAKRVGRQNIFEIKRYVGEQWVRNCLEDPEALARDCRNLKRNIGRLRDKFCGKSGTFDYVLCGELFIRNPQKRVNEIICGERWFLYAMFYRIYRKEKNLKPAYINWFYAYLVIKAHIRTEIIQANMSIGFDNFLLYQDRKEHFIEDTELEPVYLKMALRDTIYNQSIVSLEARIVPKKTAEDLAAAIQKYDEGACWGLEKDSKERKKLLDRFFYVVHFAKEPDLKLGRENDFVNCRHFQKRQEVMEQALAVAKLREWGAAEAERIYGIDACSPEIVCRPEVFAQAYRYLKNHTPKKKYTQPGFPCTNLMATYHVGEDFLDIADGLRAIDEAVSYLNLRCGDRLGHALALGLDVEEWYCGKSHRILISKQEYMDNLVWLYSKLRKYNIVDAVDAQSYIEKRFGEYFQEVYINNIATREYEDTIREAQEYYRGRRDDHGYRHTSAEFGIHEYYNAWKLRGDNPELYKAGYFVKERCQMDEWDDYAENKLFPQNYAIRYNPAAAFLYKTYHYNYRVRKIGAEMVEIRVLPCMVHAVKMVQRMMQREVSALGIAIETNPSSNYLISSFRRYDRHPIVTWYNNGLTYDETELKSCPQIPVSINTDDQGVFATYLENEYAYMALALEKHVNEQGQRIYNRALILQWLDNIRKMGIDMSFGKAVFYKE